MSRLALPWSDPVGAPPSPLHGPDRQWSETNCYVDLWVEVLHAMGADPRPALACALGAGYDDPQWTFLKPSDEDLVDLYGVRVHEMNVWRPVLDHVVEQLRLGRLLTVEVDGWWLPDTAGVSYHLAHAKTSLVVGAVDLAARRLGYFHGAGYHELAGDDLDGAFGGGALPPYVELVRFGEPPSPDEQLERALAAARRHLARGDADAPVARMAGSIGAAVAELGDDPEAFHLWAFGTWRQCGATAELAADWCRWAAERCGPGPAADLDAAAAAFGEAAGGAKAVQFAAARLARGRRADPEGAADAVGRAWARGLELVGAALAGGRVGPGA